MPQTGTAAPAHHDRPRAAKPAPTKVKAKAKTGNGKPVVAPRLAPSPSGPAYVDRADVAAFAAQTAAQHPQLSTERITATLAGARYQPMAAKFIMPAAVPSAKNWAVYRARFIEPRRISAGLAFWQAQAQWLSQAEQRWGVPASIIVAIIGVETLYGQHTGTFRAIDALATLSFDFPTGRSDRSAFFQGELRSLFLLADRDGIDVTSLRSSYAGAMGLPQFMPRTWLRYAVDFDQDGRIDLHASPADVVGSVARYLAAEGWQRGMPTHFAVQPPDDAAQRAMLLEPDILPSFTPNQMTAAGARLAPAALSHDGLLALVELRNGDAAPSHIAGTENFWAVTRYNWSAYYAMAVIELAEALQAAAPSR